MDELITLTNLQKVLEGYARDAEELYKKKIADGGHNASFSLAESVKSRVVVGDISYKVTINLNHYWKYLERGRQGKISSPMPHHSMDLPPTKAAFPPVNAIINWINIKPILPRPMKNGKFPTIRSLAYLIGRKIEQYGIEPFPAMAETIEELDKIYEGKIAAALQTDMGTYLRKILPMK